MMQFTFTFGGGDPQDLTIVLSGRADPAGLHRLNDALGSDPRFRAGLAILVDVSALDVSGLDSTALAVATEPVVERDWFARPLAVAIVAPDENTFARAAEYRAYVGGSRSKRRVFSSEEEAHAWLREQRVGASS